MGEIAKKTPKKQKKVTLPIKENPVTPNPKKEKKKETSSKKREELLKKRKKGKKKEMFGRGKEHQRRKGKKQKKKEKDKKEKNTEERPAKKAKKAKEDYGGGKSGRKGRHEIAGVGTKQEWEMYRASQVQQKKDVSVPWYDPER